MISVVFYQCNQKTLCDVLHICTENEIYVYEFRFLYLSANNNNIINITRLYGQTFKMRFFTVCRAQQMEKAYACTVALCLSVCLQYLCALNKKEFQSNVSNILIIYSIETYYKR